MKLVFMTVYYLNLLVKLGYGKVMAVKAMILLGFIRFDGIHRDYPNPKLFSNQMVHTKWSHNIYTQHSHNPSHQHPQIRFMSITQ